MEDPNVSFGADTLEIVSVVMNETKLKSGPKQMKWTKEQTLKFVQEYVKYECLYNNCTETKGKKYTRNEALTRLAQGMNLPEFGPKEAYAKVRNLRSTYSQEVKKLSLRNAADGDTKYESNLIWFKTLDEALKAAGNEISREINTYYDHNTESFEEGDEIVDTHSFHKTEVDSYDETFDRLIFKVEVCSNEEDDAEEAEERPVDKKKTCKRKRQDHNFSTQYPNFIDAGNPRFSENEFDAFGKSIAAQLKNMPLKDALEAEMYIQNYLSNVRLRHLVSKTN